MKRYWPAIVLLTALLTLLCTKGSSEGENSSDRSCREQPKEPVDTQAHYDSLLNLIRTCQDAVFANPHDMSLISPLLAASFDTTRGSFFVVGKATFNPVYPENARENVRERAVRYVGERWALYLKKWHTDVLVSFGTKVSGKIMYSKELYSEEKGDTLYQLLSVPIGSVVLDGRFTPQEKSTR